MVGRWCRWDRRGHIGRVWHARYWGLRIRRMHGAINRLRLVHGVGGYGRRLLEMLLWNSLGRIVRRLVMHVWLLVLKCIVLAVLRR